MSRIILLTNTGAAPGQVLPALELLSHHVRVLPAQAAALVEAPAADAILLDARTDLAGARTLSRALRTAAPPCPLLVVLTEGGLTAVGASWGQDDVILGTAGPAEVEARLRIATERLQLGGDTGGHRDQIRAGALVIDESSYTARVAGRQLDLTYKEFELLRHLAQHPNRVFSRAQLLQEVWGYDYFGGTRTVDVHVRRLRAKLGGEHDGLIGTVRNVGYRFTALDGDAG